MFGKKSKWREQDFLNSKAYSLMRNYVDPNIWVDESIMTKEEKEKFPSYKTCGGYLKKISLKEAWANAWGNFNKESKEAFTSLPNFNWPDFTEITGIQKEKI